VTAIDGGKTCGQSRFTTNEHQSRDFSTNATNEIQVRPFEALKTNKVVSRKGAKLAKKSVNAGLCELCAFA